jgi:hypothetical protein
VGYATINTGTTIIGEHSDTHPDVHEMPIGGVTIVSAVLAHRGYPGPVLEGETLNRYRLEELGQGLILGEIGLEEEEIRRRSGTLGSPGRDKHTAGYAAPIAGSW